MDRLELEQDIRLMGFPLEQLIQILVLLLKIRMKLRGNADDQLIDLFSSGGRENLREQLQQMVIDRYKIILDDSLKQPLHR
ncbi:hypothetical protein D3C78_1688140 [compost metagenome]